MVITAETLAAANSDGYAAYQEGRLRAPAASAIVMGLIGDAPIGTGAADLFAEFLSGFDRAADEAIAALLFT